MAKYLISMSFRFPRHALEHIDYVLKDRIVVADNSEPNNSSFVALVILSQLFKTINSCQKIHRNRRKKPL